MKNKIKELWEDYIVYYLYDNPTHYYKVLRMWWRCNGTNPYHWKLVWYTMFHHYGWDMDYSWQVTKLMIQKSKHYFEHHRYISDEHIEETTRWQGITIALIDIILEKTDLFDWNDTENGYECLVNVNLRNADRFAYTVNDYFNRTKKKYTTSYKTHPHLLYQEKARVLLLKILEKQSINWYD